MIGLRPTERLLKVAIVAPPWFDIPPNGYGGIEWLCYWLVEGLVERGHDVTLIGAGRDRTRARFARTFEEPPSGRLGESLPEILHAARAGRLLDGRHFDVVHDHSFAGPLLAASRSAPTIVTAHGPVGGEIGEYYRSLGDAVHLVAISDAQRGNAPALPWDSTIHNAVPVAEYPFRGQKEDFVLFLGRLSPEKGAHLAIDAAREAGWPLVLAGKCTEEPERDYFEREVRPRLGPDVDWIGPADAPTKKDLLSRARCLVFPIRWEEPFGIVMAEALACGTPVVALRGGSVDEVVLDEVTGFVRDDPSDLPEIIKRADTIDPQACRDRALLHFDVGRMVSRYEAVYRRASDARTGGDLPLAAGSGPVRAKRRGHEIHRGREIRPAPVPHP